MKKVLFLFALVASLYANSVNKCYGCHGTHFEKSAMNKSKVVADMNATELTKSLSGYQNGTYGGSMKSLMKAQVADLNITKLVAEINSSIKK